MSTLDLRERKQRSWGQQGNSMNFAKIAYSLAAAGLLLTSGCLDFDGATGLEAHCYNADSGRFGLCPDAGVEVDADVTARLGITLAVDGHGTIETNLQDLRICAQDTGCTTAVFEGTSVVLLAVAGVEHRFVGWRGCPLPTAGPECAFDLEVDAEVTAVFEPDEAEVTVSVVGSGQGAVLLAGEPSPCVDECSYLRPVGADVMLQAVPSAGSVFVGWSGDCAASSNAACALTARSGSIVIAEFSENVHVVTVEVQAVPGATSGQVRSSDGRLDCPGRCAAVYAEGATVSLEASADPGGRFLEWNGACEASEAACSFTVVGPTQVGAEFEGGGLLWGRVLAGSPAQPEAASSIALSSTSTSVFVAGTANSPMNLGDGEIFASGIFVAEYAMTDGDLLQRRVLGDLLFSEPTIRREGGRLLVTANAKVLGQALFDGIAVDFLHERTAALVLDSANLAVTVAPTWTGRGGLTQLELSNLVVNTPSSDAILGFNLYRGVSETEEMVFDMGSTTRGFASARSAFVLARAPLLGEPVWLVDLRAVTGAVSVPKSAVGQGPAGPVFLVADYYGDDVMLEGETLPAAGPGQRKVLVAAFAPESGSILWHREFGQSALTYGRAAAVLPSGDVLVAGTLQSELDLQGDAPVLAPLSGGSEAAVYLAQLSRTDGRCRWATKIDAIGTESVFAVASDAQSQQLVVVGSFGGGPLFLGEPGAVPGPVRLDWSGDSRGDLFVAKYDDAGEVVWARSFGGAVGDERVREIGIGAQGRIVISGTVQGAGHFDHLNYATPNREEAFVLVLGP